jgi:putative sterol carrier protein
MAAGAAFSTQPISGRLAADAAPAGPKLCRQSYLQVIHSHLAQPQLLMPRYNSIDDVIASYPSRFRADRAEGIDDVVQLNLTGQNARPYYIHVHDQQADIEEGTHASPTLTLTADADDWLAIENGQANPMMMLMQGKLKLKGSVPFATRFMGLFGGGG